MQMCHSCIRSVLILGFAQVCSPVLQVQLMNQQAALSSGGIVGKIKVLCLPYRLAIVVPAHLS